MLCDKMHPLNCRILRNRMLRNTTVDPVKEQTETSKKPIDLVLFVLLLAPITRLGL